MLHMQALRIRCSICKTNTQNCVCCVMQDAEDIIDDVTALLEGDKSKDVRTAVVLSLPLTPQTLPVLLERARDVSPVVSVVPPP